MATGSDTTSKHIAQCLASFYDQDWISASLVKLCLDLHLPNLFEFLLEQYPGLLTQPGSGGEPSIKQVLANCAEHHCYNGIFYCITQKITEKYY